MITNEGKELISKFLLGQAPEYATHLSIGCGATPLDANDTPPSSSIIQQKDVMDFEMTRVPITSKGIVEENGQTKLTFSAQLPNENRYDITEVALWSAAGNSLAPNSDSKMFFNFNEAWERHDTSIAAIPFLENIGNVGGDITAEPTIFSASTNNSVLRNNLRVARKEGPRFLNRKILMRGDTSVINDNSLSITSATANGSSATYLCANTFSPGDKITVVGCSNELFNVHNAVVSSATSSQFVISSSATGSSTGGVVWETGSWTTTSSSTHIHLNGINFFISNNSASDILKLSFSLIDRYAITSVEPDAVKIVFEFYRNEITTTTGFAKAEIYVPGEEFLNNRYKVIEIPISNLITSADFAAGEIRVVRAFVSVIESGTESEDFYVALDGFRIDNVSTENPLYKMVGYSIVKIDGRPIVKFQNTNNYIEFRMSLGLT